MLLGQEYTPPRTVPLKTYAEEVGRRVSDAIERQTGYVPTHDLAPPQLVSGIFVSLDAIIARSKWMREPYPFTDPRGAFLTEALTNNGYVRDPARHFTARAEPGTLDEDAFVSFITHFNKHMAHPHETNPRYLIIPHREVHPTGMVLAYTSSNETTAKAPPERVCIPHDQALSLLELSSHAVRLARQSGSGIESNA